MQLIEDNEPVKGKPASPQNDSEMDEEPTADRMSEPNQPAPEHQDLNNTFFLE